MEPDQSSAASSDRLDQQLLEDARLVAAYAYRSGQLKDDKIFVAISQFEEDLAANRKPNRGEFAAAVSKMVASIAPMSLQDLREGKDAFSPRTGGTANRAQVVLSSMALVIMFSVGYYSLVLNEQLTAVDAYTEIKTSNLDDKFTSLRKHWRDLADTQVPEDARFDILHHEIEEMRTLRLQAVAAAQRVEKAQRLSLTLFGSKPELSSIQAGAKDEAPAQKSASDNAQLSSSEKQKITTPISNSAASTDRASANEEYNQAVLTAKVLPTDICAIEKNIRSVAMDDYPIWAKALLRDLAEELCIRSQLGIASVRDGPVDLAPQYIYVVRENVGLLQSWILPGLLGLLGATFYLLRNLYDVHTPYVGGLTGFSRIALGGVAGIAVGWLVGSRTQDATGFSSLPLATALVAGFSVDIVFALLDKLKKAISDITPNSKAAA
jgi:hypothetical protein